MAYNKTTWQTGDTITAEKLNNMENGIEYGCPLIIHATPKEGYTWYSSLPLPCDLDVSCSDLLTYLRGIVNQDANTPQIYIIVRNQGVNYIYLQLTDWYEMMSTFQANFRTIFADGDIYYIYEFFVESTDNGETYSSNTRLVRYKITTE